MLKPVAAGLMCLGFVTLGVAMSRGQDSDSEKDLLETGLIVIDGKVGATEVNVDEAKGNPLGGGTAPAEVQASGFGTAGGGEGIISVNGENVRFVQTENGDVIISNEDGKVIEKHAAGSEPARVRFQARATRIAQLVDPQTRDSLEKMTAGLKEQIQKLESEGKKEEAQQKAQSLRAIDSLLHGNPRFTALNMVRNLRDPMQTMEEIKKLHARRIELAEQVSKLSDQPTERREKLQQEIKKLEKEIAEKHQALTAPFPAGGQPHQFGPGQPFAPGMGPHQFGQQPQGAAGFHGYGIGFSGIAAGVGPGHPQGFGGSEGMVMLRKSEALSQAAAQLKQNGLNDQAQPLPAQAEEFKAKAQKMMQEEAEKQRAQAAAAGGFPGGGGGFGAGGGAGGGHGGGGFGFGGGGPMDLHNSLRELQEQIQQLRKEVGEVRELLQRK